MTKTNTVTILFLGDIFGEPGRRGLQEVLPKLKQAYQPDAIFVNCENAANGRGISYRLVKEILDTGVDFMTSGNHIYQVKDIYNYLDDPQCKIIRPYNFPRNSPGRGLDVFTTSSGVRIGLINLMGNLFMQAPVDSPFTTIDQALLELQSETDIIVVDFHAEATSEKRALAWHLDGKIQLLVGTHTHVMTADEDILPEGMAFITDLGMCGPFDSVIGMDKNIVLKKFRTLLPNRFDVAKDDIRVNGIVCEIDVQTKKAVSINRIQEKVL
ncbi:MAG: TIGR00282 family metallophosphoesterase [bacterium]|nr:TIGR00282 family metallophosphoesterase [bacterium]MBU1917221.1 TIGR00282 family metallophosphoesterase [bacterium]